MHESRLKQIFGRSLRRLRIEKEKTQSELAEETGISEEYLSKIERGLASPSFLVISRLTDTLGVRPSELFRHQSGGMESDQAMYENLTEAEELLRGVIDGLPLGMFVTSGEGRLLFVTPALAAMLGFDSPQDMLNLVRDIRQVYSTPSERGGFLASVPSNGSPRSARLAFKRRDGRPLAVTVHIRRLPGHEQPIYSGIVEEESTSRLVFSSAGEQDKLVLAMREFHHRTQNAFTLLHSYLEMELLKAEDSPCRQILDEIRARVYAMARLHRRLVSPGVGRMRVREYLREILGSARGSLPPGKDLRLDLNIEDVELDWQQALALGMIILELVTNAVKHGYPQEGGSMDVRVSLARKEALHRLEVADNGVGLPQGLDLRAPRSFGLALVNSLVNQLRGDLNAEGVGGARFSITFPAN